MTFSEEEVVAIVRQLDEPCWSCRGLHEVPSTPHLSDDEGKCAVCNGSGYVLTEAGDAVLEFIRRHNGELRHD